MEIKFDALELNEYVKVRRALQNILNADFGNFTIYIVEYSGETYLYCTTCNADVAFVQDSRLSEFVRVALEHECP